MYKLITCFLTNYTHSFVEVNDIIPLEQKGYRRDSYGCKDQQLMNKVIPDTQMSESRAGKAVVAFLLSNADALRIPIGPNPKSGEETWCHRSSSLKVV